MNPQAPDAAPWTASAEEIAADIDLADARLNCLRDGAFHRTPLLRSAWLEGVHGGLPSARAFIKLESEQATGSFKARGALNFVATARSASAAPMIVTASTGNHGLGVAHALSYAGGKGARGVVFVPADARPSKVAALRAACASVEVRTVAGDCLAAERAARAFAAQSPHARYLSPYNDRAVVAGQGTVGLEIDQSLTGRDSEWHAPHCVYVTVGGGGLIAGVASYLKKCSRAGWRVVGAVPARSPVMAVCVGARRIVEDVLCAPTLADGSAGLIEQGAMTLRPCVESVDEWILVEEEEIADAVRQCFLQHRKVVEGSAGVALAAFVKDRAWHATNRNGVSVVVACGGNIEPQTFIEILSHS